MFIGLLRNKTKTCETNVYLNLKYIKLLHLENRNTSHWVLKTIQPQNHEIK